jgi:Lrp/AsnC family leucine-responsive transcriptional regulator
MEYDAIDRRLLALLQIDGRIAYQDLGQAVGLSGPAAFQRVRKLEARGILVGYHARVNPLEVGRGLLAFLRVVPGSNTVVERLVKRWAAVDDILECHRLGSDGGYLLKVRVADIARLAAHADAARGAGCSVSVDVVLASPFERWMLPVG